MSPVRKRKTQPVNTWKSKAATAGLHTRLFLLGLEIKANLWIGVSQSLSANIEDWRHNDHNFDCRTILTPF